MRYAVAAVLLLGVPAAAQDKSAGDRFFDEKIRPILTSTCLKCHSAAAGKLKGGLSLDSRASTLKGGHHGPAIVPGNPEKSLLIGLIGYTKDIRMPPAGKLGDPQIADFVEWVRMGAPDPRAETVAKAKMSGLNENARAHWAYQPVRKPAVPPVKRAAWVQTPIDAFILARLEERGMEPARPADKATLLRRATFDLLGMPPTAAEVEAFLSDPSPGAFAKVVDRLLASPHYGERWGRHWLDLARYSDTTNARLDNPEFRQRFAWVYRDYVIDALNQDKPYDRFILEQLAADKLDLGADTSALAALGFITIGDRFGDDNEETINERIDVVSKAFLGLTVSCARCHDHMFDPIPTADYYSLYGVFRNSDEQVDRPIIDRPNARTPDYLAQVEALVKRGRDNYYEAVEKYGTLFHRQPATYALRMILSESETSSMMRMSKGSDSPALDKNLMKGHWGWMRDVQSSLHPVWGPLVLFAELPPKEFAAKSKGVAAQVFANAEVEGKRPFNPRVAALFKTPPLSVQDVESRYNTLFAGLNPAFRQHLAAMRAATGPVKPRVDEATLQLLQSPFDIRPAFELSDIVKLETATRGWSEWGLSVDLEKGELNLLDLTHPGAPRRAMVAEDVSEPKDAPILIRGLYKGEVVPRRFLEILSGPNRKPFTEGSGRLELARAIARKENPLTARVAVNRIWLHHFGEGFVPTPENLGVVSEKPSHPDLLDWLSTWFMENGWSQKKLHRLILLSSVYQQSVVQNPRYTDLDPGNRLLWRANVRRLEFEAFRDSLLVFSGSLDPTVKGQPINLTDEPYSYRRSIYGFMDRHGFPETLQSFNVTDPRLPESKRWTTSFPQQALFTMNSPMVADIARRVVARKDVTSRPEASARIALLYRIIVQRSPKPEEVQAGLAYLGDLKRTLGEPEATVSGGSPDGEAAEPRAKRQDYSDYRQPVENKGTLVPRRPLTAWEQYAQALLWTNEVAFVH